MATKDAEAMKKFTELCKLKYKDQAVWFLNGYWGDGVNSGEAAKVWNHVKKFVELDLLSTDRKGENGNELDQFWSAKFLEDVDTAMPAMARKEALRSIDHDSNGKMSAIEYLVWKYKKGVRETVEAPQGDNTEAIRKAQQALDKALEQMTDCETKLAAQKQAEAQLKAAEKELEAAVADLHQQEESYRTQVEKLETRTKDASLSTVQKSKAANELAQLKGEDPLPLRKAKITQEAALRKVQKQKQACEAAIAELEAAYVKLEKNLAEAQIELDNIKNKPGGGKGAIWWMQREMFELDDRLPKAKQKFDHSKPFSLEL